MIESDDDLNILTSATSGQDALHRLFVARKAKNRAFSYGYVCRLIGLSSTGYLADVVKGRRLLVEKYHLPLARVLGLNDDRSLALCLLLSLDRARHDRHAEKTKTISKGLDAVRGRLLIVKPEMMDLPQILFLALDLFAAFGLFGNEPSRDDLIATFPHVRSHDIDMALNVLFKRGLIQEDQDSSKLKPTNSHVIFGAGAITELASKFIKIGLSDAEKHIDHWFDRKEKSWFTSQVLSVSMTDYEKFLVGLKRSVGDELNHLESSNGDALVRFNLHVYPVHSHADKA